MSRDHRTRRASCSRPSTHDSRARSRAARRCCRGTCDDRPRARTARHRAGRRHSASRTSIIIARCERDIPEVVFGEGKTVEQTVAICERLAAKGDGFFVTRANASQCAALRSTFPARRVNALARTARSRSARPLCRRQPRERPRADRHGRHERSAGRGRSRGDARGAESRLSRASPMSAWRGFIVCSPSTMRCATPAVVIVVAGMDGALPSVVGGLVRVPVIAVPTSVGLRREFPGIVRAACDAQQLRGRRYGV